MNVAGLRSDFRRQADDTSVPPAYPDADVLDWTNQAVEEASIRADLLFEDEDATICSLAVLANASSYALHAKVTRVQAARFLASDEQAGEETELTLIDRIELDRLWPTWRSETGRPRYLLTENGRARLAPKPETDGTASLEVYRLPLVALAADGDVPEIREQHHRYLVDWMLFRAYSKPDPETQDPERAKQALERFEAHFGPRPDADMRQASERIPQFNKAPLA